MSLKHKQEALLKVLNYLLAYKPDEFGLFPDEEGYLNEEWTSVKKSDILEAIRSDKEGKFEIKDEKVRSIKGPHSPQRKLHRAYAIKGSGIEDG
jgi:RNA:NAD 2'-phosphotransferase (TPT1/KptA family)